jgi:hypothetical protein
MTEQNLTEVFTPDVLQKLFPKDRADLFFEALYGDTSEGAYDIALKFKKQMENKLIFEFHLTQRESKCLACNLTYGLPNVFSRHPVINMKGLIEGLHKFLPNKTVLESWTVGNTQEISRELHVVPVTVCLGS